MFDFIKVLAQIKLFSGANMLQRPIYNKYRPAFDFPGTTTKISGSIELIDADNLLPGATGIVKVTFIRGMIPDKCFEKDQFFTISEGGPHALGEGKIIQVITPTETV